MCWRCFFAGGEREELLLHQEGRAELEGSAGCAHLAGRGRSPDAQGSVRQRHRVRLFSCVPRRYVGSAAVVWPVA